MRISGLLIAALAIGAAAATVWWQAAPSVTPTDMGKGTPRDARARVKEGLPNKIARPQDQDTMVVSAAPSAPTARVPSRPASDQLEARFAYAQGLTLPVPLPQMDEQLPPSPALANVYDEQVLKAYQVAKEADDSGAAGAARDAWVQVAALDATPGVTRVAAKQRSIGWERLIEARAENARRLTQALVRQVEDQAELRKLMAFPDAVVPAAHKRAAQQSFDTAWRPWRPHLRETRRAPGDLVRPATAYRPALVATPAGRFRMGSASEQADSDEKPHLVELTMPLLVMRTEVTQAQYEALQLTDLWGTDRPSRPSRHEGCDACPVENVSFLDAMRYANLLSEYEGLAPCYTDLSAGPPSGRSKDCVGYRLPTEAEWEHFARAGMSADAPKLLGAAAWFEDNAGNTTHPVGRKAANAWGLHDTLGNVWEWC
ncbi:MAG: SUMF1/EgtB/PvdO family nonheme iron enzyme, partial [Myxococcales bacterium]|nr:SUMF1/EgtB/PvdO family nonheme iron enzyme [Myxococcales bacterium]